MPNVKPLIISIWCGPDKPILNEFLNPFVTELNDILVSGVEVNGYELKVRIGFFICDSPARAFVKGIFMHQNDINEFKFIFDFFSTNSSGTVLFNHRMGCLKCTVVGKYFNRLHRMSFVHNDCEPRTDQSFRQRFNPSHHKEASIIESLPVDMVQDFPTSDPLHLLELGVMKKYVYTLRLLIFC